VGEVFKEKISRVISMLIELKNISEFMVDLAYTALLYNSVELSEEVKRLEEYVDDLHVNYELSILSLAQFEEDAGKYLGALRVGLVAESLADAALSMVKPILNGVEPHEVLRIAINESEETILKLKVGEESEIKDKSLEELRLQERVGVRIVAIRRNDKWILNPSSDTRIKVDDVLFARGNLRDLEEFRKMLGSK
jgi:uncharacterized protein with PhoU and TrkA domain